MVVAYLALVELGKRYFYRPANEPAHRHRFNVLRRHVRRRAQRFSA
jgi:hypothetical protein